MDEIALTDQFKVGDIVSFGKHWSIPEDREGMLWRVKAVEASGILLDGPFFDAATTVRYSPPPPPAGRP